MKLYRISSWMVFQKHELPLGPPPPPPAPICPLPYPREINVKEQTTDIDEISKKLLWDWSICLQLVLITLHFVRWNEKCALGTGKKKSPFTMYAVTQVPLFQAFVHS